MIAAAFVFVLSAIAIASLLAYRHERALRKHYQTEAANQRNTATFYANAYAEARWPRTRSAVSETREGFAWFATIDELTEARR